MIWAALLAVVLAACGRADADPRATPTAAPVPTATRAPRREQQGGRAATVLHVAGTLLSVDLDVHPDSGWPALAAVEAALTTRDDAHVFARSFNPRAQAWGSAQSLGSGDSALYTRFRTAAVTITPEGVVHVAWGVARRPRLGIYAAYSTDYGETWSRPTPIASDTYGVLDMAAAQDGSLFVLANGETSHTPLLIRRDARGVWQAPEALPVPSWYGTAGALVLLGEGPEASIVCVTTGGGEGSADNAVFVSRRAVYGGRWISRRYYVGDPAGGLLVHVRAAHLGAQAALFTFSMDGQQAVYGLLATGGEDGLLQRIVARGPGSEPYAATAYDPLSDQAVVLWTCCADALFVAAPSTHYAAWSAPGGGAWHAEGDVPLVSGAESAADTAIAQARNSRQVWLAWAERVHDVKARALDLALLPTSQAAR
jgi:hypothetical protein